MNVCRLILRIVLIGAPPYNRGLHVIQASLYRISHYSRAFIPSLYLFYRVIKNVLVVLIVMEISWKTFCIGVDV